MESKEAAKRSFRWTNSWKKPRPPDVDVTNSDLQNNNDVFVTEVQEFFNQRMSTVETSIKDSPSDIKSGFIEIQKT